MKTEESIKEEIARLANKRYREKLSNIGYILNDGQQMALKWVLDERDDLT